MSFTINYRTRGSKSYSSGNSSTENIEKPLLACTKLMLDCVVDANIKDWDDHRLARVWLHMIVSTGSKDLINGRLQVQSMPRSCVKTNISYRYSVQPKLVNHTDQAIIGLD